MKIEGRAFYEFNQMKANNIGIQEENERSYAIIEDLKNVSVY